MANTKIIPVTDLVRNFGEITDNILMYEYLTLTKGGRPYMILKAAPELRREKMKKSAGGWKGTDLDSDKIWKKVLKRKSRKNPIII